MFRTITAAMVATIVLAAPAQAQKVKDGSEGTGGAAGHSLELPDMSRSMAAPPPDLEAQPPVPAPAPAAEPAPAQEENKDESTAPAIEPDKSK